jgi:hypothetical protein
MNQNKILEIFLEQSMTSPADPGSGAGGSKVAFKVNEDKKGSTFRKNDARRKRIERNRQRNNPYGYQSKKSLKEEEIIDPRMNLEGPLRLTLGETFLYNIIEYLTTNNSKYLKESLELLEEYPDRLKKWAMHKSWNVLPDGFTVYSIHEATTDEQIGDTQYRSGGKWYKWYRTKSLAQSKQSDYDDYYIMETPIKKQNIILYIPAFVEDIQKLILSGKIKEPVDNVVRKCRNSLEIITNNSVNSGKIIAISYN